MKIGITGHVNIEKAKRVELPNGGARYHPEAYERVYREISAYLTEQVCPKLGVEAVDLTFLTGMARGVDEIFAKIGMELGVPLVAVIPNSVKWHKGRGPSRGVRAQAIDYDEILAYPKLVEVVEVKKLYRGRTYPYANFARNQALVDRSDKILSYRKYASNGTEDCIERAKMKLKYLGNVTLTAMP